MKKKIVTLKKLHKLFPNRTDFKPTLWNSMRYVNRVYNTDYENTYIEMSLNKPMYVVLIPLMVPFYIFWKGLSCVPELSMAILGGLKPIRKDELRHDHYKELIK